MEIIKFESTENDIYCPIILGLPWSVLSVTAAPILNAFNIKNNLVLTKIDKIKDAELNICLDKINCLKKKLTSISEKVFLTSSRKNLGIKEINQEITKILS